MKKEKKPLLNSKEQIAHLKSKGVSFNSMSEADAEQYLQMNNNYFKLRAFRKNFDKYPESSPKEGQYINLDFAMLVDLSVIDMHLRYTMLQMALDVEHFAKVKLLTATESAGEDGYQVIDDYRSMLQAEDAKRKTNRHANLQNELSRNIGNSYCGGIISACADGYPIWAFVEVIPFGEFVHLYHFCADRYQRTDMEEDYYLLLTIKELRNAAAHNNCILHDMKATDSKYQPNYAMMRSLKTIKPELKKRHLRNERMRQLCTLIYTHSRIVSSEGVRKKTEEQLKHLIERMYRKYDEYSVAPIIQASFGFLKKVVDNYSA